MKTLRFLMLILAVLCCLASVAGPALALSVTATPDRNEVSLGQVVIVKVCIHGSNAGSLPQVKPPEGPNLTITQLGPPVRVDRDPAGVKVQEAIELLARRLAEQVEAGKEGKKEMPAAMTSHSGGHQLADFIVYFAVQPELVGTHRVGSFVVTSDNETARTAPFNIYTGRSGTPREVKVQWAASKANPGANEDVQLFMDVLVQRIPTEVMGHYYDHVPLRNINVFVPQLPNVKFTKPLDEVAKQSAPAEGKCGFRIKGIPHDVRFQQEPPVDNPDPNWFRYRFAIPVQFTKGGLADLPPLRVIGEYFLAWPEVYIAGKKAPRKGEPHCEVCAAKQISTPILKCDTAERPRPPKPVPPGDWLPMELFSTVANK